MTKQKASGEAEFVSLLAQIPVEQRASVIEELRQISSLLQPPQKVA